MWPEEVPVLTNENMCKGQLFYGDKACLVGWASKIFGTHGPAKLTTVLATIKEEIKDKDIPGWNDSHTHKQCADVWNKAMKTLGYTEDA